MRRLFIAAGQHCCRALTGCFTYLGCFSLSPAFASSFEEKEHSTRSTSRLAPVVSSRLRQPEGNRENAARVWQKWNTMKRSDVMAKTAKMESRRRPGHLLRRRQGKEAKGAGLAIGLKMLGSGIYKPPTGCCLAILALLIAGSMLLSLRRRAQSTSTNRRDPAIAK